MTVQRYYGISLYEPMINWNTTNKPDIIVDKEIKECHIIDVVCPSDTRVKEKE